MVVFSFKDENEVFDGQENDQSSGVFDTKRHNNAKIKAEYRRIRKYYKSPKRYQKERKRRRRVLDYYEQGFSYKTIAQKLGVSERTVKRDMVKIKPYYERKIKNLMRKLQQERIANFQAMLEGKTLVQRFNILTKEIARSYRLKKERGYRRSRMVLVINLDDCTNGVPSMFAEPNPPFPFKTPFKLMVSFIKDGKSQFGAVFSIG